LTELVLSEVERRRFQELNQVEAELAIVGKEKNCRSFGLESYWSLKEVNL